MDVPLLILAEIVGGISNYGTEDFFITNREGTFSITNSLL